MGLGTLRLVLHCTVTRPNSSCQHLQSLCYLLSLDEQTSLFSVACVLSTHIQRTAETEVVVEWHGWGVGEGHGLPQQEEDGWEMAGKEDMVLSTRDLSEQFSKLSPCTQHLQFT